MNTLHVLLLCTLSISVALTCWHDRECLIIHHCHAACINGHCQCVECAHDADCQCPGGVTGKCIHYHHSFYHCECPAITTTTTTTTTTKPLVPLDCSHQKISVIESIAENVHVEDDRAGLCPGTNKHQTSDALVIHKCNATARSSWSKGVSVKEACSSGPLTQYTPISTFLHHGDEIAAFFVECSADGSLKIVAQTCSYPPTVLIVNETASPKASDFYTILQA